MAINRTLMKKDLKNLLTYDLRVNKRILLRLKLYICLPQNKF